QPHRQACGSLIGGGACRPRLGCAWERRRSRTDADVSGPDVVHVRRRRIAGRWAGALMLDDPPTILDYRAAVGAVVLECPTDRLAGLRCEEARGGRDD